MVTVSAPAKINLFLHVTGRREDGYHDLQSVAFFTDIADRVTVSLALHDSLTASGPFAAQLPPPERNLIWRAIALLRENFPALPALAVHLEKNLPVASGVGGGSADAAAALHAVMRLCDLEVPEERLAGILSMLGADVPMCFTGRTVFAQGLGERLDLWPPLPPFWVLLVNPGHALMTQDVFQQVKNYTPVMRLRTPGDIEEWKVLWEKTRNDLTDPACGLLPEIQAVLKLVAEREGCLLARMSGSGPTCFGLFATGDLADKAAKEINRARPEYWVRSGGINGA